MDSMFQWGISLRYLGWNDKKILLFKLLIQVQIGVTTCNVRRPGVSYPCGDENKIFQANSTNAMTADALAPCVARTSAAIVLAL